MEKQPSTETISDRRSLASARYPNPKYQVEMPERVLNEEDQTLVILCTFFPRGNIMQYNVRSYVDHEITAYQHQRLECFKFVMSAFNHFDAGAPYSLLIVDNSSKDPDAKDYLNTLIDPTANINVVSRENTYFSFGAYRHGFEQAPDKFKYFVFLEMDWTPAKHGWLRDFQEKWVGDPEIGMIGNMVENRGWHEKPENHNQRIDNEFIKKINPDRHYQVNLDSEYLFVSRFVLEQMLAHDGWLLFPCVPETTLPATFNELACQQPILEMGYKIACYDDAKHTMFYACYVGGVPDKWNHGFAENLAPFIPEQTRCFVPEVRQAFDWYNHNENNSLYRFDV